MNESQLKIEMMEDLMGIAYDPSETPVWISELAIFLIDRGWTKKAQRRIKNET